MMETRSWSAGIGKWNRGIVETPGRVVKGVTKYLEITTLIWDHEWRRTRNTPRRENMKATIYCGGQEQC